MMSQFTMARLLALVLAAGTLASCVAHGQSGRLDPDVHFNSTPYSDRFYRNLLSDRVWLHVGTGSYRNVVQGVVFVADGTILECRTNYAGTVKKHWVRHDTRRWSIHRAASGGHVIWQEPQRRRYLYLFYEPATGMLSGEVRKNGTWTVDNPGQIQDSWPRVLADGCPNLKLPAHIRINEKQTSYLFNWLRRQDPDAPVRNFPGSHLTSPGRTGIGRSGGRPTTTKAEVEAFLEAQHGNILINNKRIALTYVRAGEREELWRIGHADMTDGFWDIVRTRDGAGEWLEVHDGPRVRRRYPMGYPFLYLPTGHRHPAFQLTDEFLARPYPRTLEFMGEAYADKRFVFHPEGRFEVVDEAGNPVEGPHSDGTWMWTRGKLEMTVRDDPAGSRRVGWRALASDLDMQPKIWSRYSQDVGGW